MLGFKITSATDYVTSTFMSIATYLNRVYTFRKPERSWRNMFSLVSWL